MSNDWRSFLIDNGAEFGDDRLSSFGNRERELRAALGGDVMCYLQQYGLLAVVGKDARSFLQGQLTNDTEQLDDTSSQFTGFCTSKGRLIANFRLFDYEGTLLGIIPSEMLQTTMEQLQHYLMRAEAQLGDASSSLIQLGVSGDRAEAELQAKLGGLPRNVNDVMTHGDYLVIKISEHRYHVLASEDDAKILWSALDVHCSAVGPDAWELLNIRDGIPEITQATTESFVPQMVNMEQLGAISYTKGCYTGQEIVARTHYLGKQKRRMYRITIESDTAPKAGDDLATSTSGDNQYTGTIVSTQPAPGDGYEALAVIDIKAAEAGDLKLKNAESTIEVTDLPYAFDIET